MEVREEVSAACRLAGLVDDAARARVSAADKDVARRCWGADVLPLTPPCGRPAVRD